MLIVCPGCQSRFHIEGPTPRGKVYRCSQCHRLFRLVPKGTAQGEVQVVIANESAAFCEEVRKALAGEPFRVAACHDGFTTLETVERLRPRLLVLDVALPGLLGFEVCERVRQNEALSEVKIILVASVYDRTRYKRSPVSLYGADDYIEKHHIPDSLVSMMHRLISDGPPALREATPSELAARAESRSEMRRLEEQDTAAEPAPAGGEDAPAEPARLDEAQIKARRLARIIVSDIALYNEEKVERGVREGTFYRLLAEEIREGERLYEQRIPAEVREESAFLAEAFQDLITKKRQQGR